jgi:hypothetical protein
MNPIQLTFANLSTQETDMIFYGLARLPMGDVEPLVQKLRQSVAQQVADFNAKAQAAAAPVEAQ